MRNDIYIRFHTYRNVCLLFAYILGKIQRFSVLYYFSLLIGNIFYLADARRGKKYVCVYYIYCVCILHTMLKKSEVFTTHRVHSRVMHILKIIKLQNLQRNIQYFFHRLFHAKVNKIHKTYCLISFL